MALRQYNSKEVIVTVGAIAIDGYADGTFVVAEKTEDTFGTTVGADAEVCRSRKNDERGKVTLTLMQSSQSNDLLSALHEADKALPAGAGTVPFLMKDLSGRTLVQAQNAWIVKPPSVEFARDPTNREWVIESDDLKILAGGN